MYDIRMNEDGKDYGLRQNIEIGLRKAAFHRTEKQPWSKCATKYPDELAQVRRRLRFRSNYSEPNCVWTCLIDGIIKRNSCMPYFYEEWVTLGTSDYAYLPPCGEEDITGDL